MFTEDLTPFFDVGSGFAYTATWTPAAGGGPYTIEVIFENGYFEAPLGEAGAATRETMCWARDDQIAQGAGIKRNDALVVNAVTYKVGEIQPDGTGVSLLKLRT